MDGGRGAGGARRGRRADERDRGLRVVPTRDIARWLSAPIQAAVDFFIEDHCVICGGVPARSPDRRRAGLVAALQQPVHVSLLHCVVIENHPICGACGGRFVPAHRPGRLGRFDRWGRIQILTGERFEPASAGPPRAAQDVTVIAPFMTSDNPLKVIRLIKFSGYRALTRPVAAAVGVACGCLQESPGAGTVIVPVPMDPAARRERGFNPAATIGGHLAAMLRIPLLENTLQKVRRTRRQSLTTDAERATNVRGAFRCRGPAVEDRDVLLVDDLVTTGATAAACSVEIRAAGARSVTVLCFARAL